MIAVHIADSFLLHISCALCSVLCVIRIHILTQFIHIHSIEHTHRHTHSWLMRSCNGNCDHLNTFFLSYPLVNVSPSTRMYVFSLLFGEACLTHCIRCILWALAVGGRRDDIFNTACMLHFVTDILGLLLPHQHRIKENNKILKQSLRLTYRCN